MRIAIHHREGSFSSYWTAWCDRAGVPHVVVDAYRSDIVPHLRSLGCDGFMWPWHQTNFADQLFARQLTLALQHTGIRTFPDVRTSWHFDDKVGQKYLLEAVGVPFVPTHVFYDKNAALAWLEEATFPLVHKLRGGAGAQNVHLVRSIAQGRAIVARAFGRGFAPVDLHAMTREAIYRLRRDRDARSLLRVPVAFLRAALNVKPKRAVMRPPERGYVYFQEFVAENRFDDRFVVIGDRCFCVRRGVRPGDFRASGSGLTTYEPGQFPPAAVALAFTVADRIGSQSLALDVIYDRTGAPLCVELSYAFPVGPFLERAGGYFDRAHVWNATQEPPPAFMVADFVDRLRASASPDGHPLPVR
jgi:hypothetical protein